MLSAHRRQCPISLPRKLSQSTQRHVRARHGFTQKRTPEPASPELASLLAIYAQQPPRPLTLGTLLSLGDPLTGDSVLKSASYAQSEIPRRLATRIRSLEGLPFIVGTNPYVARIMEGFRKSFEGVARFGDKGEDNGIEEKGESESEEIRKARMLEENERFAGMLEGLVRNHANDIPTIAKGFQECQRYMSPERISSFLDAAIRNRVAVRLIAEQHIALTHALKAQSHGDGEFAEHYRNHIGIVNMKCSPLEMIRMVGSFVSELSEATLGASPSLVIDGHTDATFAYVPVHLEYILTEILKNAFRATVEHHLKSKSQSSLPPVHITISPPPPHHPSSDPSFLSIRVRDQGGGVHPSNLPRIFSYSFTTASSEGAAHDEDLEGGPYAAQHVGGSAAVGGPGSGGPGEVNLFGEMTKQGVQTGLGTIAGLGFGLPMSRLYARYFGGSLDLYSMHGWGSDVILKLRCLDTAPSMEI